MNELLPVYSPDDLKRGSVYQIEGALYAYQYPDPYAQSKHPRYIFKCLGGQRKKTDITLNRNTLRKAYLVPGYQAQRGAEVIPQGIQQSLF